MIPVPNNKLAEGDGRGVRPETSNCFSSVRPFELMLSHVI
jgi:hypothetical protein